MRNFIYFLFLTTSVTFAVELTCQYRTNTEWWAINYVYFCDLKYDVNISKCDSVVTSINGSHWKGKSNTDVVGFGAYNKKLEYFLLGLSKFFDTKNIQFVAIWSTGLNEIHQRDLSPFTGLRVLSLWDNRFEVIEKDLLKFNPEIEYIGLGKNKIIVIDGNVFDHLKNLHTLHIDGNACISSAAVGNKNAVGDLLDGVLGQSY